MFNSLRQAEKSVNTLNNKPARAGRCFHLLSLGCHWIIALICPFILQMTGRYAEYAEELANAVRHDFKPHIVKE